MKSLWLTVPLLMLILLPAQGAFSQAPGREREEAPIELRPEAQTPEIPAPEKITPEEEPEGPEPGARENLGPVEKVRVDELEREYATGKINQAAYQLEKEAAVRDEGLAL